MKKILIIFLIFGTPFFSCDKSEEVVPLITLPSNDPNLPEIDSTAVLFFQGEWQVLQHSNRVCESTSGDCHEVVLGFEQQLIYEFFYFYSDRVIAKKSNNDRDFFRIIYVDQDYLIFENDATDNKEWNGSQIVEWENMDYFTMTNVYYSQDSIFEYTDTYYLERL